MTDPLAEHVDSATIHEARDTEEKLFVVLSGTLSIYEERAGGGREREQTGQRRRCLRMMESARTYWGLR